MFDANMVRKCEPDTHDWNYLGYRLTQDHWVDRLKVDHHERSFHVQCSQCHERAILSAEQWQQFCLRLSKAINTAAPRSEEGQQQKFGPCDKTPAEGASHTVSESSPAAPRPCVNTAMEPDGPVENSPGHSRIPIDVVAAAEGH